MKVLNEMGFENPTDIQAEAIPQLITGDKDLIGLAQTGTGKTAAFGLPLLERIDPSEKHTQGLILAPTRELANQIAEQLHLFSKYMDRVNVLCVYGGAPISGQMRELKKGQHVIIATPGRLIDLIKRRAVRLDKLEVLILDEADEMLDMGFKDELDEILSFSPDEKNTWLFSATMAGTIKKIVKKYMDDPIEIKINPKDTVNVNIQHRYTFIKQSNKSEAISRILDINEDMRGVVFCRTKRDTQNLAEELLKKNYKADALHGDLSQAQRDRVMKRFKSHELQVLIATDVAARGIDVNDITHVIHHTLPDDDQYYTHRSGRTARAGKKGVSIAFVSGREKHKINRFERVLNIVFKQFEIPSVQEVADIRVQNWVKSILTKQVNRNIPIEVTEKVNQTFGNLTKEELIDKILSIEYAKLNLGATKDLNETPSKRDQNDDGRGGRNGRSGGRGGRGSRGGRGGRGGGSGRRSGGGRSGGGGRRYEGNRDGKKKDGGGGSDRSKSDGGGSRSYKGNRRKIKKSR